METLSHYADPAAGILGFGFLYLFALFFFICIKTKKGRKFLGLEE